MLLISTCTLYYPQNTRLGNTLGMKETPSRAPIKSLSSHPVCKSLEEEIKHTTVNSAAQVQFGSLHFTIDRTGNVVDKMVKLPDSSY